MSTVFAHVEPFPGDPILTLNEAFGKDERAGKVNLSIGVYYDDAGKLPVMRAVRQAEEAQLQQIGPRPYQPMAGALNYRQGVQKLLFGAQHEAVTSGRIATIQSIGGSGALRVGGDFLKRYFADSAVYVSDPTWDNHRSIFESCGFETRTYPYYDAATGGVNFDGMLTELSKAPAKSIVLLHACCHNPTGVDLSAAQWTQLIDVVKQQGLIPFLDIAYQGFGDNLQDDAFAPRALAAAGLSFFIANSFSKSMSVYGERCGALSVVCPDAAQAERVLGQLKATVRRNYSSPAIHAAGLIARVLTDPQLRTSWETDVAAMRERILAMRRSLHGVLSAKVPGRDLGYFLTQRGMFSYTGLSAAQVDRLRDEHAVYLVRSGRMCVAGLSTRNVQAVAEAFAAVV
ncbi:MAG: aspartate/tyrosine/aromatic aminotransferase [Burkholderiaceae bacterium]|nr:MAG: aspartate/tyrosine/aromatic aminotransferase [Burkholderiaceae bacterium]